MNHFARCCTLRKELDVQVSQIASGSEEVKMSGRIVRSVNASSRKLVSVQVKGTTVRAMPETGSDWDCMSEEGLKMLKMEVKDLMKPAQEMMKTQTAIGSSMKPLGYLSTDISFGEKTVKKPIVVFNIVDSMILSKETMEELDIVRRP